MPCGVGQRIDLRIRVITASNVLDSVIYLAARSQLSLCTVFVLVYMPPLFSALLVMLVLRPSHGVQLLQPVTAL